MSFPPYKSLALNVECPTCHLKYTTHWCYKGPCVFCKYYAACQTKLEILAFAERDYLWSGYTSRPEFFFYHLQLLQTWCDLKGIPSLTADAERERELLATQDWTREYWH